MTFELGGGGVVEILAGPLLAAAAECGSQETPREVSAEQDRVIMFFVSSAGYVKSDYTCLRN